VPTFGEICEKIGLGVAFLIATRSDAALAKNRQFWSTRNRHGRSGGIHLSRSATVAVLNERVGATPDFAVRHDQTLDTFSRIIAPAVTVPYGSVVESLTHEALWGQLTIDSTLEAQATSRSLRPSTCQTSGSRCTCRKAFSHPILT